MNFERACELSNAGSASGEIILRDRKLEVFKHRGGRAKICSKYGIFVRNALPKESGAVKDWRPLDVDM